MKIIETLKHCGRCGEGVFVVSFDGLYMVRPRRISKCKGYSKGRICSSLAENSEAEAIKFWNDNYGILQPVKKGSGNPPENDEKAVQESSPSKVD